MDELGCPDNIYGCVPRGLSLPPRDALPSITGMESQRASSRYRRSKIHIRSRAETVVLEAAPKNASATSHLLPQRTSHHSTRTLSRLAIHPPLQLSLRLRLHFQGDLLFDSWLPRIMLRRHSSWCNGLRPLWAGPLRVVKDTHRTRSWGVDRTRVQTLACYSYSTISSYISLLARLDELHQCSNMEWSRCMLLIRCRPDGYIRWQLRVHH